MHACMHWARLERALPLFWRWALFWRWVDGAGRAWLTGSCMPCMPAATLSSGF